MAQSGLADALLEQEGRATEAASSYLLQLSISESLGDLTGIAKALVGVGRAWASVSTSSDGDGNAEEAKLKAREYFEKGAQAARDVGDGDLVKIAMEGLNGLD